MPSSRLWPYPLTPGTHVIATVRNLALTDDVEIVGTIARVLRTGRSMGTCIYAVRTKDGVMIQTLASRTIPIDTTTTEGLDQWLDRMEQDDDLDGLPTATVVDSHVGEVFVSPSGWYTAMDTTGPSISGTAISSVSITTTSGRQIQF